jgi:hypothetical protein
MPDPVTSPSGKMFIVFMTNYTNRAPGWTAYYETDLVGLSDKTLKSNNLHVYPNPSSGDFIIKVDNGFEGYSLLRIHDLYGRMVFQDEIDEFSTVKHVEVNHLSPGLYYMTLMGDNSERLSTKIINN